MQNTSRQGKALAVRPVCPQHCTGGKPQGVPRPGESYWCPWEEEQERRELCPLPQWTRATSLLRAGNPWDCDLPGPSRTGPHTAEKVPAVTQTSGGQEQRQNKRKVQIKASKGHRARSIRKQQLCSIAHTCARARTHTETKSTSKNPKKLILHKSKYKKDQDQILTK